jgi:hypothetical protein
MNKRVKEAKRNNLKAISRIAQQAIKNGATDAQTVNEFVINSFKSDNLGIEEFHTFNQWKEKGFKILKGSTAYVVWGSPRKGKANEPVKLDDGTESDEFEFFPLCYLFSNLQVEKSKS